MIGNNPVKHLNQERKFLQDPAMNVVGEARTVRSEHEQSTVSPTLGKMLCACGIFLPILVIRSVCPQKFGRRPSRIRVVEYGDLIGITLFLKNLKVPPPRDKHGCEQDDENHLLTLVMISLNVKLSYKWFSP